jgi:hypothetical protein
MQSKSALIHRISTSLFDGDSAEIRMWVYFSFAGAFLVLGSWLTAGFEPGAEMESSRISPKPALCKGEQDLEVPVP